jgi:hypothetical protein
MNLKYTIDPRESEERYEKHKKEMVTVKIPRPPDLLIDCQIPLAT